MKSSLERVRTDIDAIFVYQFVVYLGIWCWALYAVITGHQDEYRNFATFLIAPPVVAVGYLLRTRFGTLLCAAGDAPMSFATGYYAHRVFVEDGMSLDVVLAGCLALCMLARFVRDVLLLAMKKIPTRE